MEASTFDQVLAKFKYPLSKPSRSWWLLMGAMLVLVAFGLVALIQQIVHGHIVTGMRDHVVWGVFIVNFIFFLGIGYSGAILAGIFHLTRLKWTKPIHRIVELFALAGLCVGPIFIFLCIGRLDRIFYIFTYARIQSPITWDVMAIMTNLIFIGTYLYIAHIRDFAKLRDTDVVELPGWKKKLYAKLALGYEGRPRQVEHLNRAQNILAATIIPTAILADSLLAWLFGMSLRPGWHSTLFAPEFILVAIFSGVALLIVMMWIYRRQYQLKDLFTDQHFYYLGYALLLLSIGFAYFTFSEYITEWYNVSETHGRWLDKFVDFGEFGIMSLLTIFLAIVVPLIVLIVPRFRTPASITLVSVLVLIGLWLKRYLIIVPTLETPYVPIQDMRMEYLHYQATWVEWALTLAGLALGVIIIMLLNTLAPVVPVADMEHDDEIVVPKPFYETIK
ncbi:MAG: polysulfide reductase NrfD [Saprospiraceae bacterium]|nr:polysulfide reductase NrfD [Saprospiraceae bacterium]